jgi:hypothetical protein
MVNNCLVKKLKGAVDNNALNKLGEIWIGVADTSGHQKLNTEVLIIARTGKSVSLKSINSTLPEAGSDTHMDRTELSANSVDVRLYSNSVNDRLLSVISKYDITWFEVGTYISIDLDQLQYSPLIRVGQANNLQGIPNAKGKLSTIISSSKDIITNILLKNAAVEGKVEDLYDCLSLGIFNAPNNFVGDWYELVEYQRAKGKTSGTITSLWCLKGTLNGTDISSLITNNTNKQIILIWTSTTAYVISYMSNKVFCIGFSDSEISEKTSSGGDWEGFTVTKCD